MGPPQTPAPYLTLANIKIYPRFRCYVMCVISHLQVISHSSFSLPTSSAILTILGFQVELHNIKSHVLPPGYLVLINQNGILPCFQIVSMLIFGFQWTKLGPSTVSRCHKGTPAPYLLLANRDLATAAVYCTHTRIGTLLLPRAGPNGIPGIPGSRDFQLIKIPGSFIMKSRDFSGSAWRV